MAGRPLATLARWQNNEIRLRRCRRVWGPWRSGWARTRKDASGRNPYPNGPRINALRSATPIDRQPCVHSGPSFRRLLTNVLTRYAVGFCRHVLARACRKRSVDECPRAMVEIARGKVSGILGDQPLRLPGESQRRPAVKFEIDLKISRPNESLNVGTIARDATQGLAAFRIQWPQIEQPHGLEVGVRLFAGATQRGAASPV